MIAISVTNGKTPPDRPNSMLPSQHAIQAQLTNLGTEMTHVSRQWHGTAKPGRASDYIHHLETETFRGLAAIPGFIRASILKRETGESTEFQIVTEWESIDAIHAFAGADIGVAVVPEAARALLSSFDEYVVHYEIERVFEPTNG